MKNKRTFYFIVGISILFVMLFINATTREDTYFPFIKAADKKENLALPLQNAYAVKLPESVSFAGENVPLDDIEVRERLDRELSVNAYWQSSTIIMLKRANRWLPTIEKILKEESVPDDFKYLCMAESALDNAISSAGASGFWQFMKTTGLQYGLIINSDVDERYNLEKSTRAACRYLRDAKEKTGSWTAAAAGYNMGLAGVNKQQLLQGETAYYDLFLNTETSRYVQRIVALKIIHQHQKDYGFYLTNEDLYPELKYTIQQVSGPINWVSFAKENNTSYKMLRIYNPWIRNFNLLNKERRTFDVKIPS
ncbi:MAG TPA: lytic transglycosylase domain-containing protein [Chitinophagales bacterium]|nr:lytic transglycosylase domain-containing protein [Chitinophagales bacterium]HMX60688.1 lytic transglycosylase domain-containing protein [Chitinophagales bacterium]HMY22218.1 lytic transglycosylase domain-containing protein [Chitinophagales bacterium]HMZ33657.1 lytic transglycosylase domain-containing protein [Chitinophagales bacterium]HNA37964.1 lytic transglycosylase domain-containing protein [Chitinophagales bacterium]